MTGGPLGAHWASPCAPPAPPKVLLARPPVPADVAAGLPPRSTTSPPAPIRGAPAAATSLWPLSPPLLARRAALASSPLQPSAAHENAMHRPAFHMALAQAEYMPSMLRLAFRRNAQELFRRTARVVQALAQVGTSWWRRRVQRRQSPTPLQNAASVSAAGDARMRPRAQRT